MAVTLLFQATPVNPRPLNADSTRISTVVCSSANRSLGVVFSGYVRAMILVAVGMAGVTSVASTTGMATLFVPSSSLYLRALHRNVRPMSLYKHLHGCIVF